MCSFSPPPVEPCPFLPEIGGARFPAAALSAFRDGPRGVEFFHQCLCCAQSRWLEGLPAQALLMINRAMGARLDSDVNAGSTVADPIPYRAVVWILRHGHAVGFIGNPRRHFQHLATRMSGHEIERRTARAWACWELAKLAGPDWSADVEQLEREGLVEPTLEEVTKNLAKHGLPGEVDEWLRAMAEA